MKIVLFVQNDLNLGCLETLIDWFNSCLNFTEINFQERLEAAAKESTAVVASLDEDGAPTAAEVVVACPMCKLTCLIVKQIFIGWIWLLLLR